jgi:hypothetical protein|tara:strand:- start:8398 stop:9945 length:1548 start_codon:yes stop_codon:yes gene_type:complete
MGGSGGHMKHPFEIREVRTGLDLLNMFFKIADVITNSDESSPTSLKLDGANTSFKVINSPDSPVGLEFALDRGSQAVEDIEGITLANVRDRFIKQLSLEVNGTDVISKNADWYARFTGEASANVGEVGIALKAFRADGVSYPKNSELKVLEIRDHGLVKTTTTQLELLNKVFEVYPQEAKNLLQIMGLVDEDGYAIPESFLINTEYIDELEAMGPSNVIRYGSGENYRRILSFHGLTEIQPSEKGRGKFAQNYPTYAVKSGDVGRALSALARLIETANEGSGWEIFDASRSRMSRAEGVDSINLTNSLNMSITVKINPQEEETKTIQQWLQDPRIDKPPLKTDDEGKETDAYIPIPIMGKLASPVSKNVYKSLIDPNNGNPGPLSLQEMVGDNPTYQSNILTGAVFYHATKEVGRDIKSQLVNLSGLGTQNMITLYDESGNITDDGHEGVAVQSEAFGIDADTKYPYLIKIVGDFLHTGVFGRFAKPEKPVVSESFIRKMVRSSIQRTMMEMLRR